MNKISNQFSSIEQVTDQFLNNNLKSDNKKSNVSFEEILKEIILIARENNLIVFSDEIYDRLLYDDLKHTSIASLCNDVPVITFSGLSKSHMMAGFRIGWMIITGDKSKIEDKASGLVEVMNIKLDPSEIDELVKEDGFYRAYHMNKKYWITIILDGTVPTERIMELIEESHSYTETRKKTEEWIIPANPKLQIPLEKQHKENITFSLVFLFLSKNCVAIYTAKTPAAKIHNPNTYCIISQLPHIPQIVLLYYIQNMCLPVFSKKSRSLLILSFTLCVVSSF